MPGRGREDRLPVGFCKVLAFFARFVSNANFMHRKIALTIFVFALASAAFRAKPRRAIFSSTRSVATSSPPRSSTTAAPNKQRDTRERWLKVDVQFSTVPEFTDEVTFKYYIADQRQTAHRRSNARQYPGRAESITPSCMCRRTPSLTSWAIVRPIRELGRKYCRAGGAQRRSEGRAEPGPGQRAMVCFAPGPGRFCLE